MGFWGSLGKGLLKYAAPVAASFIPGVGPLAAMAISGATGAASKKLEGGSWKDALLSGGIGAGAGYLGGKIPGLGPSAGTAAKGASNAATTAAKQGIGSRILNSVGGVSGAINKGMDIAGDIASSRANNANRGIGPSAAPYSGPAPGSATPRGSYTSQTMVDSSQRNPDLADFIGRGRTAAVKDQQFRKGYDVNILNNQGTDDTADDTTTTIKMPKIGNLAPKKPRPRQVAV